jgi:hypothetical protein
MRRASLSLVSIGFAGSLVLAIVGASAGGCSSNDCPLGTDGCGCNAPPNGCNAGLQCIAQPSPVNGVCLTPAGVAALSGGGSGGSGGSGLDAPSGDAPNLSLADSAGGGSGGAGNADAQSTPIPEAGITDTAPASTNLITNGNFSSGTSMWGTVSGSAALAVTGGQLCLTDIDPNVQLAWPQPSGTAGPALVAGASYTLSYMAMATVPLTIDAKVGETNSPYTADYETTTGTDPVTATLTSFTHTFTEGTGDTSAGLAFTIPQEVGNVAGNVPTGETQICFANVSLVKN